MRFRLAGRAETARWGEALGRRLQAGDFVALVGDLGAGKTTLTQGIARGLGVRERVTSPTFTLVQEYSGRVLLFHFDPYRLENGDDLVGIGWEEYSERGGVIIMEWADRVPELLPTDRLTLRLEIENSDENVTENDEDAPRLLTAQAMGERSVRLLDELWAAPGIAAMRQAEPEEGGAA